VKPQAIILECPFNRLIDTVGNRFAAMGVPAFPFAQLIVFWGGVQRGFSGFDHNPVDYARSVQCPTLVLHGQTDPRVTEQQVTAIYDNVPGEKRLVMFAGVGHQPYLAKQPEKWRAAVETFLDRP
jgi:pimeloyl-ACP methyl ester carboxylesterase